MTEDQCSILRTKEHGPTELRCTYCDKVLPLEYFTPDRSKPQGYTYDCKKCRTLKNRMRREGDFAYKHGHFKKRVVLIEKHCTICNEMVPIEKFSPDKRSVDGKYPSCMDCSNARERARRLTDRERLNVRHRRWSARRRKILNAQARTRYPKYRTLRGAAINARSRARWHADPEVHRFRLREYRRRHPELIAASIQRRRARLKNVPVSDLTAAQWLAIQALCRWRCVYCGKKTAALTQDHIIPLSKNGNHSMDNVVPACRSCNSRKHTGPPLIPVQPLLPLKDLA